MKRIAIVCLFMASYFSYGQTLMDRMDTGGVGGTLFRNKVMDKKAEDITGTPYLNENFFPSDIAGTTTTFLTRYNAYKDEVEIKYENETFVMPKDDRYPSVKNIPSNYTLQLVKYTSLTEGEIYGYLIDIYSNENVGLYRREKTILRAARESGNSYSTKIPASYTKGNSEYYLKTNASTIVPFPKNKKALIEMYPGKKTQIDEYLKANKVSWKNEEGMTKITQFIATL